MRLAHEEDPQLLRAVVAGDREAFRSLVERYRARLYRFVLRQVRRPAIGPGMPSGCPGAALYPVSTPNEGP
jgi:hypothetical protein